MNILMHWVIPTVLNAALAIVIYWYGRWVGKKVAAQEWEWNCAQQKAELKVENRNLKWDIESLKKELKELKKPKKIDKTKKA